MTKRRCYAVAAVLLFAVFMTLLGLPWPFELAGTLTAGWLFFLVRVVPAMRIDATGVVTFLFATGLFTCGAHFLCRWLYAHFQGETDGNGSRLSASGHRGWTPLRSLAVTALTLIMFVAGTAMLGIAHQAVWLATRTDPIFTGGGREAVRRQASSNNLKHIGLAFHKYEHRHGSYPAGISIDQQGRMLHSWQTRLLPYLEHQATYDQIDPAKPWRDAHHRTAFQTPVVEYLNPQVGKHGRVDAAGYALSDYAGNPYLLGGTKAVAIHELTDGVSKTILVGEVNSRFQPWGDPTNWRDPQARLHTPRGFGAPSSSGLVQFLWGDGRVTAIREDIDPALLHALFTPRGAEPLPLTSE